MKKLSQLFIASLFTFLTQAQVPFTLVSGGINYTANNNTSYVFETNELSGQGSQFKYNITNSSSQPLNFKTQIMGVTNYTAGQDLAFCFAAFCEFNVVLNQIYPGVEEPFLMQPGENMNTVGENDCKFQNTSVGTNPNAIKEFVIRFYAENPTNNQQVGGSFTLTFRFNPNLSTTQETLQNLGIQLQSTLIKNEINFSTQEKTQLTIIDITGKVLYNASINEGTHAINADFLHAGVYFLSFETASNRKASQKIIKK